MLLDSTKNYQTRLPVCLLYLVFDSLCWEPDLRSKALAHSPTKLGGIIFDRGVRSSREKMPLALLLCAQSLPPPLAEEPKLALCECILQAPLPWAVQRAPTDPENTSLSFWDIVRNQSLPHSWNFLLFSALHPSENGISIPISHV